MHMLRWCVEVVWRFPRLSQARRSRRVQAWALTLLTRLDVELKIVGTPPQAGPLLLVANHISWVDILVFHATCHCRFVAKADVKRWPIIGTLATGAGTLYVQRESRRDAMRIVRDMEQVFTEENILVVFPEGTTGDGDSVLPFHANLIQAAISADAPVQAVAIQYVDAQAGKSSRAVSYTGDESLMRSIWRTLAAQPLCAVVSFGRVQRADGRDRRTLAQELRNEIVAMRQA
jgi:1-acyl-sn-glycerol-3-phosphate acyltransferase